MQQALDYAAALNIPFAFSSNGDGFVFHDRSGASQTPETTLPLEAFPSPAELWARYRNWKGLTPDAERIVLQDYFDDGSGKAPRYYQCNAVNAAVEAIAKGQNRILLVMATGTGKTYTAFRILWRLWKAKRKKRILYLADRNVLIDQTMVNDFCPFGTGSPERPVRRGPRACGGRGRQRHRDTLQAARVLAQARTFRTPGPLPLNLPTPVAESIRGRTSPSGCAATHLIGDTFSGSTPNQVDLDDVGDLALGARLLSRQQCMLAIWIRARRELKPPSGVLASGGREE